MAASALRCANASILICACAQAGIGMCGISGAQACNRTPRVEAGTRRKPPRRFSRMVTRQFAASILLLQGKVIRQCSSSVTMRVLSMPNHGNSMVFCHNTLSCWFMKIVFGISKRLLCYLTKIQI